MVQASRTHNAPAPNPARPGMTPLPSPPGMPASNPASPRDTFRTSSSTGAALGATAARGKSSATLQSAATKIRRGIDLLLCQARSGIVDAATQLFAEKARSTDDAVAGAKTRIRDEFAEKQALTKQRILEAEKSLRALESMSVWDKLVLAFKAVATVASAMIAAATGGVFAWTTAALLVVSFAAPIIDPGQVGAYIGIGCGMAAALLSLGTSAVNAVAGQVETVKTVLSLGQDVTNTIDRATRTVVNLFPATWETAAGGCEVGSRVCHADSEDAKAAIIELKARMKRVMQDADEDREEVRELMDRMHKSAMTLVSMLTTESNLELRPAQMAR